MKLRGVSEAKELRLLCEMKHQPTAQEKNKSNRSLAPSLSFSKTSSKTDPMISLSGPSGMSSNTAGRASCSQSRELARKGGGGESILTFFPSFLPRERVEE